MFQVMLWDPVERFLFGMVILLMLICVALYIYRAHQQKDLREKMIMFGFVFCILGITLFTLFHFIGELLIPGIYENGVFTVDLSSNNAILRIFFKISRSFYILGFTLFFLMFEYNYKHTKFSLTIISTMIAISIIVFPYNIEIIVWLFGASFILVTFLLVLFIFVKWSTYELKGSSLILSIGFALYTFGGLLTGPATKELNAFPLILAPIFNIIGASSFLTPTLISPKNISKLIKPFFYFLIVLYIPFTLLAIYLSSFGLIYSIPLTSISYITLYPLWKFIKSDTVYESKEGIPNILEMFVRPKKVSEEEISVSKERKTCLVCKGNLARNNIYLCPGCNTLYCIKCSDTLTTLENECWVCELPFDISKPQKMHEKEDLENDIDMDIPKNK